MKQFWKWVGIAVAGMIVVLGVGSWYLSANYKPLIKEKLAARIASSTDSLYRLHYDDLTINLLSGTVVIKNAELVSDSLRYQAMVKAKTAPEQRVNIQLHELTIENINLWRLIVHNDLRIRRLAVDTLALGLLNEPHSFAPVDTPSASLARRLQGTLKALSIAKIEVNQLHVHLSKIENGRTQTVRAKNSCFQARDFLVTEQAERDTNRFFYTRGIELTIPNFSYQIPESVYQINFEKLHVDTESKQALFSKIKLHSRISEEAYFRQDTENKALISLAWDTLHLKHIDFHALSKEGRLHVAHVDLKHGHASFKKDKRYQKDNVSKIGQAPHQHIMKLKPRIRFDRIFVSDVAVIYRQMSKKHQAEGAISFQDATGTITNLTNDTAQLKKDRYMRADLRAAIMGTGPLHARFGFDMLSTAGHHTYSGSLGKMQAPAFNSILRPLLNFEIASGNIRSIRFDMQGTDYKNWGELRFDYDHLKISVFRAPAKRSNRSKKGILSFLVNQMLVHDSNPDANEHYHIGRVQHTRVPEYSHFKTIWKSLFEGIVACAGINPKYVPEGE
ncbi:hypothetical protein [Sphingobacterium suaedae]|uniref:DUF748 domain-containing protein n=1 Tax=Sphingobacterium suaedae TaxID=1686402 RepID=A0ABW5KEE7_9SPHI